MKTKNIIKILVWLVVLEGIVQNATAMNFQAHNYDTGFEYNVSVTLKVNTTHAKIYVQDNETLKTEQINTIGFSGLPENYSGVYYWGRYTLGEWDINNDVYYILVYDGNNDSNLKYDTIMLSKDKNFSNDRNKPFNETPDDKLLVGEQNFIVSGKSYTLLSIADDGNSIVLKPNFMPDADQLKNEVDRL
ncbi:hypothetical protein MSIBF_A2080012 [groundwater metagenome]|uniref:Uncharacterized protein n=1 Tax=groundwater metagenome TaxID=717931 RepID=A0A098E8B7_9ZZZZ